MTFHVNVKRGWFACYNFRYNIIFNFPAPVLIEFQLRHCAKKRDRMDCNNYRGIVLLNLVYKVFSKILLIRLEPHIEECLGEYQCEFWKNRSTLEQLAIIGKIIEKKYEYRQNMWQVFVDFRKAYDSVYRDNLYNIINDFVFPRKLIKLTKMCMEEIKYRVRVDNKLSSPFTVDTGLKQDDSLSPVLFNLALEKMIRKLQQWSWYSDKPKQNMGSRLRR